MTYGVSQQPTDLLLIYHSLMWSYCVSEPVINVCQLLTLQEGFGEEQQARLTPGKIKQGVGEGVRKRRRDPHG